MFEEEAKEYEKRKHYLYEDNDYCGDIADRIKIPTDLDFIKTQSLVTGLSLVSATDLVCFDC